MKSSEEVVKEICEQEDFRDIRNQVNLTQRATNDLDDMDVGGLYNKAFAITIRKMQESGKWPEECPVNEEEIEDKSGEIWDACRADNQDICAVVTDHYALKHQASYSNDDEDGMSYILDNSGDIEITYHQLFDN